MTITAPIFAELRVGDLTVDPTVQRHLNIDRATKISKSLDRAALAAISVSIREDGSKHIIDGQTRHAAVKMAEGNDAKINALCYFGLSLSDEAAMFRLLNTTKLVHPLDRFRIRLIEGDPAALEIVRIVGEYGWKVSAGGGDSNFAAVVEMERIYNGAGIKRVGSYPEAVRQTISTITEAWGHNPDAVRREIVGGVGRVFIKHPDADARKIAVELAKNGGPLALIADARQIGGSRQRLGNAVAELVVRLHNKGRRSNRLPAWDAK